MIGDQRLSKLEGSRCLVTGGAGAIGSNLTRALLELRCSVTVLDNLSSGTVKNLGDSVAEVRFVRGDVNSDEDLALGFANAPEYVFHLAAHFANQNSVDHPLEDCMTNANGTIRLLEFCRTVPGLRRLVYASSSCVLGHSEGVLHEETPFLTDTPYAVSKLAGELYTLIYHRVHGVPVSVVRYFNVYGPGEQPGRYRNVLPNFIARALSGLPLVITGTGDESREFVFVDDAVKATLLTAATDIALGEVIHIGSGAIRTIRELAERVIETTASHVAIEHVARRGWDSITMRQTSSAKAQTLLGYEPSVSFEDGLARTVAWIRALEPEAAIS